MNSIPNSKKITQQEFMKMVDDFANRNALVKKLITEFESYENLPKNIKHFIDKEFGIERVGKTLYKVTMIRDIQEDICKIGLFF